MKCEVIEKPNAQKLPEVGEAFRVRGESSISVRIADEYGLRIYPDRKNGIFAFCLDTGEPGWLGPSYADSIVSMRPVGGTVQFEEVE